MTFIKTILWAIRHPRYAASQFVTGMPFSAHYELTKLYDK